jgi:hypothetical protein
MFKSLLGAIALATSFGAFAQALQDSTPGCIRRLASDARLAGVADKVALNGDAEVLLSLRALDRVPTADERQVLELWSRLRQQCFNYGEFDRNAASTRAQAVLVAGIFDAGQKLIEDLQNGRLTYADFNSNSSQLQEAVRPVAAR